MEKSVHSWLRKINLYVHASTKTPLLDELSRRMLAKFKELGHQVQSQPNGETEVVLTGVRYGEVLEWRKALFFTTRNKLKLKHSPVIFSLVHITPQEFGDAISHFEQALEKQPLDFDDFIFAGLAPSSPKMLAEQGRRGGPIMALMRVVQAQAKSIRVLLAVGDEKPEKVYHFDLVGAHPSSDRRFGEEAFYEDIVLRIATTESTWEVTKHQVVGEVIPLKKWESLPTVDAMCQAAKEIGSRNFFTDTIRIVDLVPVPAVSEVIADQYSEGCFFSWDPELKALIATITGSARPVDKGNISADDLAVIVGVRSDGLGVQVGHIEGRENLPPSSEAFEMVDMDSALPRITLGPKWAVSAEVPVIRSKLHGHRGVYAFNHKLVEFVLLDPSFYQYLVSCATEAQASGIKAAFSRAESLKNPHDPRHVAFTVLPGHGVVMVEKWVPGKAPFQVIWEYMDAGHLEIDNMVPQGVMSFSEGKDGRMELDIGR